MRMASAFAIFLLFIAAPASAGMSDAELSDAELKGRLIDSYFYADEGESWQNFRHFTELSAVTDEQLHRVLMEIYNEADDKLQTLTPGTEEWNYSLGLVDSVIRWLPSCKGIPIKDFLLAHAASKERHRHIRRAALISYLRIADAQETRDVLLHFLAGERCGVDPLSVYSHAAATYDQTPPEDEAKRRAIIAALMVAAAREDGKIGFVEVDRILSMRSDTYRRSGERLALLEHHSLEPPTRNLYTDADLKAALAESRRYRKHTSVNTNAALLQAHDFSGEHTPANAEKWGGALVTPSPEVIFAPRGVPAPKPALYRRSIRHWLLGIAGLGGLVAAFALWRNLRRKRGSA
jgi:hypothetical protein